MFGLEDELKEEISKLKAENEKLKLLLSSRLLPIKDELVNEGYIIPINESAIKQSKFVLSVDTLNKNALAYCFGVIENGVFEIMLSKTMHNETEFNKEVENLAKYFNIEVILKTDPSDRIYSILSKFKNYQLLETDPLQTDTPQEPYNPQP